MGFCSLPGLVVRTQLWFSDWMEHASKSIASQAAPVVLFKDLLCPFICSERFPDDTLWFVFEEDFQMYEGGEVPPRAPEERSDPVERSATGSPSRQAVDLVRMASKAARLGYGDFIWFGYNPRGHDQKDPQWTAPRISFGSQGIALTKKAARSIHTCFSTGFWSPNHIDMELMRWAKHQTVGQGVGRCWIWPPIGSYAEHDSECCFATVGHRPGLWGKDWISPGTSIDEDPQHRDKEFYKFVQKGHQERVGYFQRADYGEDSDWKSFWADPPYWKGLDTDNKKRLARRQWRVLYEYRHWTRSEAEVARNSKYACLK